MGTGVGLWSTLWTLLTSELITLASYGHTFTAHLLTSGKIKIVSCVSDPKFCSRGFPLHALASVLGLRHFVPWRTKSSAAQESPSSHSRLPQCREWRIWNQDDYPLFSPLAPCTPGGED